MLTRYRKRIRNLLVLLRRFEADTDNLNLLSDLQRDLYRSIACVERSRARLKDKLVELKVKKRHGRASKEDSVNLKSKIKSAESGIAKYDEVIYLIRAIGDGAAFTVFDKWDLKPLHFKEAAGHVSGKSGARLERRILNSIIKKGVPAIHCDVTNVIRYGDVCAQVHSFPLLIEVKSSKNKNERLGRQLESIRKLHEYWATDEIEGLYGVPRTTRVAPSLKEIEYSADLNELIAQSASQDCAWKVVEPGLAYVVMRRFDETAFEQATNGMLRPVLGILNQDKFSGLWASYRPYTIAIRDVDSVLDFALGHYSIIVIYDEAAVFRYAEDKGYLASLVAEHNDQFPEFIDPRQHLYRFSKTPSNSDNSGPAIFYVSLHFMLRSQFEFVSIKWLVEASIENIEDSLANTELWEPCNLKSVEG